MTSVRAVLTLALALPFFSSCASYFVRQGCNEIDWFSYGRDTALAGKRFTGDATIKKCEQAEANVDHVALDRGFKVGMEIYCDPDTAYQVGRRGDFFTVSMCDGERPRLLQQKHAEGVRAYCAKANGYNAGIAGRKYNNICPKDLETAFVPEFNKGRLSYLISRLNRAENELRSVQTDLRRIESDRFYLSSQLSSLGDGKVVTRTVKYDPLTQTHKEETEVKADQATENRRRSLQGDLDNLTNEITRLRNREDQLRGEARDARAEIDLLGHPFQ